MLNAAHARKTMVLLMLGPQRGEPDQPREDCRQGDQENKRRKSHGRIDHSTTRARERGCAAFDRFPSFPKISPSPRTIAEMSDITKPSLSATEMAAMPDSVVL